MAATPANPSLPDVQVPAIMLSAGATQDMDQSFLSLLQLLGPDGDDLVSGAVDLPAPTERGGLDLEGLQPDTPDVVVPELGTDGFVVPPNVWHDVLGEQG